MSRLNKECNVEDMNYTLQDEGRYAGHPIVNIIFGERQSETGTVKAVKALMDRYGWTDKVRSPRTPLVFSAASGSFGGFNADPAGENHMGALKTFSDVLRPRQTWLNTRAVAHPQDDLDDIIDFYTLHLSQTQVRDYRDGDRDVWQWYAKRAREDGNVDFVIEAETVTIEEIVQDVSQNYTIPDDRIFIYPAGDTISEVNDRFYKVLEVAKRNEWRMSPRMSFLQNSGETEDTDEA